MIRIVSAAAVTAALAFSTAIVPAMAQDVPSRTVSFADLDLTRTAGQAELRHRIHRAVLDMCGDRDSRDLAMGMEVARCRKVAFRSADREFAATVAKAQALAKSPSRTIEVAGR